jgi:hypothetical protein
VAIDPSERRSASRFSKFFSLGYVPCLFRSPSRTMTTSNGVTGYVPLSTYRSHGKFYVTLAFWRNNHGIDFIGVSGAG